MLNYEEQVANLVRSDGITFQDSFISLAPYALRSVLELSKALINTPISHQALIGQVKDISKNLFFQASEHVKAHPHAPDDRPLYWARLKLQMMIKACPNKILSDQLKSRLMQVVEENSRNYVGINFDQLPLGCIKVLITGFDTFLLNSRDYPGKHNIRQSNPSGNVALSLHHTFSPERQGFIQSILFPVRYSDFDGSSDPSRGMGEGIIEQYLGPWLNEVDLLITISQGHPDAYSIDSFATRTRGGMIDNNGFRRIPGSPCVIDGPSWIPTTLPKAMLQSPIGLCDSYQSYPDQSPKIGLPSTFKEEVFSGPGGNYLSNEIYYRVARLREKWCEKHKYNNGVKPVKHTQNSIPGSFYFQ